MFPLKRVISSKNFGSNLGLNRNMGKGQGNNRQWSVNYEHQFTNNPWNTACRASGLHIPLFQAALITCPVLQLLARDSRIKGMLYRAEGFVRMGGDPRVMQEHGGTGEVLKNLQLSKCHCPSHAHSKRRVGGVGSWSWMCRGAWRITKCLFKAGPIAGCLVTRELFCRWVSSCRSVCTTGNIRKKPFVQKGSLSANACYHIQGAWGMGSGYAATCKCLRCPTFEPVSRRNLAHHVLRGNIILSKIRRTLPDHRVWSFTVLCWLLIRYQEEPDLGKDLQCTAYGVWLGWS